MIKKLLIGITATILLYSCANIVPPSGGPRDLLPPQLDEERSIPNTQNNTNYNKDFVELVFDENITVKNPSGQISTTPLLDTKEFKVTTSKNVLRLNFNQDLDPNTTYIINFGKSITDVTEGNIVENIQVAFSTGSFMDSLTISGSINQLKNNLPLGNAYVYLYDVKDTIKALEGKPKYYTKTSNTGNFHFKYLKEGTYDLVALNEKYQNYIYERGKEQIAFITKPIQLSKDSTGIQLVSIIETDTSFRIISRNPRDNYYQIKLNKGFKVDNTEYPKEVHRVYNSDRNIIQLFHTKEDSVTIQLSLLDSTNRKIDSTFNIKTSPKSTEKLITSVKPERINDSLFLSLNFSEPINFVDTSLFSFYIQKDSILLKNRGLITHLESNNTKFLIYHPNFKRDTLRIDLNDSSCVSIMNTYSKSKTTHYKPYNSEDYGLINGSISNSYENYIIQLIDNKGLIYKTSKEKGEYTFTSVLPGSYTIRILIDENNDGKFEQGSYEKRITPELIYFYENPLNIKANWDFLDTNISF